MKTLGMLGAVSLLNGLSPLIDKSKYDLGDTLFLLSGAIVLGYIIGAIAEGVNNK